MIQDLSARLLRALDSQDADLLRLVANAAEDLRMPLYAVGGLPRDLILRRAAHDFDLVVEGDAIVLAQRLARSHGGSVVAHHRFGTATWSREPASRSAKTSSEEAWDTPALDLITARTEVYAEPAQLPRVERGTIEDDLRRRDFTINGIAIRLDGRHFGEVLDPLDGMDDLRARRLRVLHDRSFVDDPTRMYRAVRYEQRLHFRIDRPTIALLPEGGRWVQAVSGPRLRNELDLILMESKRAAALKRLSKLGLLRRIHPALPADARCLRRLDSGYVGKQVHASSGPTGNAIQVMWMLWLMDLRPAALHSLAQRLAWNRKEAESISAAADLFRTVKTWVNWRPSRLTGKLDVVPQTAVESVCAVLPAGKGRQMLEQYLHSWRHVRARTTGRDLQALGLAPGPVFRRILETLRAAWIDGAVRDAHGENLLLERLTRQAARSERGRAPRKIRQARRS